MEHQAEQQPVLIVDLAQGFGGAEVRVLDTARLLHGQWPYAVATLSGSPLHQRLEAANLAFLPVPFSHKADPRLFSFLWREIRRGGYRIVDAHNVQSQFWSHLAALLTGRTKLVTTVHSAYKLEHNGSFKGRLYEQIPRLNAWWGAQFIAVSEAVAGYLESIGVPKDRISLIQNSITLPETPVTRNKELPLLTSPGWQKDTYLVTVVARLEPVKGHTYLLEALSQVAPQRPQIRCLIVGDGRVREALESQVERLSLQNHVNFAGFRDDVSTLLNASDLFCLPSLSEGLPYALLEACAQRLPVLVSEVGGMAQLLQHKHTAFLVPPADPAALAQGLIWLMDHPAQAAALGQAAFELLQQEFNPADMINKTLSIYQQP